MNDNKSDFPRSRGLIFPARAEPILLDFSDLKLSKRSKWALEKDALREFSSENEGFSWILVNDRFKTILPTNVHDLCKLVYLASYITYHGKITRSLRSYNPASNNDLDRILGITKSPRNYFLKSMIDLKCICSKNDALYINKTFLRRGHLPKTIISATRNNGGMIFRVFSNAVRDLYWQKGPRGNPIALRYLLFALPYLHSQCNVLCFNPSEENLQKIIPMKFGEFCDAAGYDRSQASRLFRTMSDAWINTDRVKERAIIRCISKQFGLKKPCIFINPHIFFAGNTDSLDKLKQTFKQNDGVLPDTAEKTNFTVTP